MLVGHRRFVLHLAPFLSPITVAEPSSHQILNSTPLSLPKPFCITSPSLFLFFSKSAITHPPSISKRDQPLPPSPTPASFSRDGNYDEEASLAHTICNGCGVRMQDSDPKQPGFFIHPSSKPSSYKSQFHSLHFAQATDISTSLKVGSLAETDEDVRVVESEEKPVVCARCHSLRHYSKVKDPDAENLLPDFDFHHTVGRRLVTAQGAPTVVLLLVDAADFDGSWPKKVAEMVAATAEKNRRAWKEGKPANVPRLVLVVTKIDLLPPSLSPGWLEQWVRRRAREGGGREISRVHFVSSVRGWGVKNLLDDVCVLGGLRGRVWAVGAQNVGKSTLINAMGKHGGGKVSQLTEAPVPGTTLGILRVDGVLRGRARLFDTPGLLHPHQISTRLTRDELRLVQIDKELKPRTYRIRVGHSVHIGGLARLDTEDLSVDTIYVTVWASTLLPLHMGKTENATTMLHSHFGRQLQPPIGDGRAEEMGRWERRELQVRGGSWESNSADVAVAGLGWYSIGLKGEAVLGVWTYDGVGVMLRDPLIPHRSHTVLVSGFTVSKTVSCADRARNTTRSPSVPVAEREDMEATL